MPLNQRLINDRCQLTLIVVLLLAAVTQAQTFTTLYSFTGASDGAAPFAGVIQDSAGNLYGTGAGENYYPNLGVVFEVNTAGTETVLHSFSGSPDGDTPFTPVVRDKAGNIYGTTQYGGTSSNCDFGCGTAFKIDAKGNETVLHSFSGGSDGYFPVQGLVMDEKGNLYGTTFYSYSGSGYGTIFKLDRAGNFTLLHSFAGGSLDGALPIYGHLTMDKVGNLYGVTAQVALTVTERCTSSVRGKRLRCCTAFPDTARRTAASRTDP
jgi:uncharacterized repeat protein (TIGR03803 family)